MFNVLALFNIGRCEQDLPCSRKAAQQWLETLPTGDVAGAQGKIVDKLKRLLEVKQIPRDEFGRLEAIEILDQHVQPLQATLCQQYLHSPRMSKAIEHRLWNAIYAYYITISHVYFSHLKALAANPHLRPQEPIMPRLCSRALYNLGSAYAWRYLRYDVPDSTMWDMLHALYRIAEGEGFENQIVAPYAAQAYRSGGLLLRAELLALAHPGSLQSEQISLLDQWLLDATQPLVLEKSPNPARHHYFIDLVEAHGALPATHQVYNQQCRGWDMSSLIIQLQRNIQELASPKSNGQHDPVHRQKMLATLSYVEKQWHPSQMGKLRKNARVKTRKSLFAVHGMSDLFQVVKKSYQESLAQKTVNSEVTYNEMVDLQMYGFVTDSSRTRHQQIVNAVQMPGLMDHWETENVSNTGFLVHYPEENSQWLRLACLVGIREEHSTEWKACTVRRLIKTHETGSLAGIEIIAHSLVCVTLESLQPNSRLELTLDPFTLRKDSQINQALLTSTVQNNRFTLLLDSAIYGKTKQYRFQLTPGQEPIVFMLGPVLERGDLWTHAEAFLPEPSKPA